MKSCIAMSGAIVLWALCAVAQAGEITLYEHAGFAGRSMTLRGMAPNLSDNGFNDMVSSIVVRSGTWEVCTDAGFHGRCATFRRGEYGALDREFNDSISSVREITGGRDERRESRYDQGPAPRPNQAPSDDVVLYEDVNQGGRSFSVRGNIANLDGLGFNDQAGSMVVNVGRWEMCTDAGYAGRCTVYGPGTYDSLGAMSKQISSLRRVR